MKKEKIVSKIKTVKTTVVSALDDFMKMESTGGLLLLAATIIALILANSPFFELYNSILKTNVAIQFGTFKIDKALLLWINDGLMAIFFFLIGLEIKREILEGELSSFRQIILPGLGALGGMIVPACIYAYMNWNDPAAIDGWAIPVATDIAFALALLSTFGARAPLSLKVFLLTLAIFDDLAAIVIIALFYSGELSLNALAFAFVVLSMAVLMNKMGVVRTSAYILIGIVLWAAILKSGVHATLAGVLIALCIPIRDKEGKSPLKRLEHNLHGPVAFAILPIFAFANAGLALWSVSADDLIHPITAGVVFGLTFGKPIGILGFVGAGVALGVAKLPRNVTWTQLSGVAFACGIGFTMSLFIAGLAFNHDSAHDFIGDRIGILAGSIISAVVAYITLNLSLPKANTSDAPSSE